MAYWHDIPPVTGGWLFLRPKGSRVTALFRGRNVRKESFQGYFMRYEGEEEAPTGVIPHWRRKPEGWFELWPYEPMLASSMEEAKALFQPLLPQIEAGSIDAQFEKRPYQPPEVPQLVKEIEHSTHLAKARIVQYLDGVYFVGYLVYASNGRYFPASTPSISTELEYEWGVTYETDADGERLRTLADDLASAEEIAAIELNRFVALDPDIRVR